MQPLVATQFGQQFQAFQPQPQYVPQKSYEEIVTDISQSAQKDSRTAQLVSTLSNQSGHPLELGPLFWNKYSKLRVKAWGGAVTDQTLLINNQRMPIIRKANYSESTWPVSIDTIPITVGNESKDEFAQKSVISLREYLSSINQYISSKDSKGKDTEDEKESPTKSVRKVSLLAASDSTVVMNTQCCLMPVNPSGCTSFTMATMNWKAGLKNPSCLYIVSTVHGTSSVVVEGNFQKIYFNKNGRKSPFLSNVNDPDPNQCITVIQVPLKQKSRKQIEQEQATNSSWGLSNWWSSGSGEKKRVFDVLPTNCKDAKVQSLLKQYGYHEMDSSDDAQSAKISRSGIKVIPNTVPTYCCTRELEKNEAQTCYGEQNSNVTVSCDGCGESYTGSDVIWHCPETISELHPNGYDLCDNCAQRQVVHDELRGLKGLRRDDRYPIRVTLLYYKRVSGAVVSEQLIREVIQQLAKVDNLGRVQQQTQQVPQQPQMTALPVYKPPPVNRMNPMAQVQQPVQPVQTVQPVQMQPVVTRNVMPSVPKVKVNPSDYRLVGAALKELGLSGEYLKIFQSQNVTDSDLKLLNDNDLSALFVGSVGPRARFRAWLAANGRRVNGDKRNVDQNEYRMINQIFGQLSAKSNANASRYVSNFVNNGITDQMVNALNDEDLVVLIPDMAVRVLFRAYLTNKQQAQVQQQQTQRQVSPPQQQQQVSPQFLF
eukprot:289539_1